MIQLSSTTSIVSGHSDLCAAMWLSQGASKCWHHIRAKVCCWCADDSPVQRQPDAGTCTEVVSADGLVELLHERAQAAVDAGSTVRAMPVSLLRSA